MRHLLLFSIWAGAILDVFSKPPDITKVYRNCERIQYLLLKIYQNEFSTPDTSFYLVDVVKKKGSMKFERIDESWPDSLQWIRHAGGRSNWIMGKKVDSIRSYGKYRMKKSGRYPEQSRLDETPLDGNYVQQFLKKGTMEWNNNGYTKWHQKKDSLYEYCIIQNATGLPVGCGYNYGDPISGHRWDHVLLVLNIDGIPYGNKDSVMNGTCESALQKYREWYARMYGKKSTNHGSEKAERLRIFTADGEIMSGIKGKKYILDFFYLSCGPCILSMPEMNAWKANLEKDTNVVFLHVNSTDDSTAIARFEAKRKFGYRYVTNAAAVQQWFNVHSFPTFIILDDKFRIKHIEVGFEPVNTVQRMVWKL